MKKILRWESTEEGGRGVIDKDAETLKSIFEAGGMVYVKQRACHLSYEEDPKVRIYQGGGEGGHR